MWFVTIAAVLLFLFACFLFFTKWQEDFECIQPLYKLYYKCSKTIHA